MSENTPTWSRITARLVRGEDLEPSAAAWAMDEVMTGAASAVQLAGFLVALQAKKVTSGELEALADSMIAHARPVDGLHHGAHVLWYKRSVALAGGSIVPAEEAAAIRRNDLRRALGAPLREQMRHFKILHAPRAQPPEPDRKSVV